MPDTVATSPDPPSRAGRARRVLRAAAIGAAVVVTVLAAAPPDGPGGDPGPTGDGWRSAPTAARPPGAAGPVVLAGLTTPSPGSAPPAGPPPPPAGPGAPDPAPAAGPLPPSGSPVPPPVRPPGAGRRAPGAEYAWPLHPAPAVTAPFRRPSFRFGRGHRGADLAGVPGQAVLAAREGTVVFTGRVAGRPVVSVDHPDGLRTTYEPVVATVAVGDRLTAGDPIGVLVAGHGGCTAAACLHWGVRRGKVDYLDPLVLVRSPRLRLLPWAGA